MPVHKIISHAGHDEHAWEKADVVGSTAAAARFAELKDKGYLAVDIDGKRLMTRFDADVEVTRFQPQLVGG